MGTVIGTVGMSGNTSFEHVHFEVCQAKNVDGETQWWSCDPHRWLGAESSPPDDEDEEEKEEKEDMNLLYNGDFEADWSDDESHRCLVFGEEQAYETDIGNIFTPPGWTTWFRHIPDAWDQPEARDARKEHDPNRVHSGDKAMLLFTFGRKHDAGFLQVVDTKPGQRLRLTAWCHAWSNHNLPGHEDCFEDGRCSCGVGTVPGFWWEDGVPPLNEDPWNDAKQNFLFAIGIDPMGGADPYSDTVVWGRAAYIYNTYAQLEVEATAEMHLATVFLRSATQWAFKHNDSYWDDIVLEEVDEMSDERGKPRVQYERFYILLPQNCGKEWALAAVEGSHGDRRTVGYSADDAGVADLDVRNVIAVNPGEWPGNLREFFAQYYEGVNYIAIEATTPQALREALSNPFEPSPPSGILLWQCDPRWKNEMIASQGCSLTLCQTGCWISASAMAQRYYGIKDDATPSSANQALGAADGFSGCLTLWSGMKTALGLEVVKKTLDDDEAQQWLDTGNVCFAEVEPETHMHFVLVTKYQGARFWMHDSYKNIEGWVDEYYPGVESWRLVRPFEPEPPPPPPTSENHIGLHLQTMSEGWDHYLANAKPRVTKVLASMHDVLGALRACPETKVIWRHVDNDTGNVWGPDPQTGAQNWLARFHDSLLEISNRVAQEFPHLPEPYFYAESINESYNSNAPDVTHAANIDIEYIHAIEALDLPVKAAVFCAAVGNPHHLYGQYELLLPLARVAAQTGSPFGYHAYWLANPEYGGPDHLWKYLAGRWTEIDDVLRAHGVHVRWFFGECGGVGGRSGYHPDGTGWVSLNANSGWKDGECYAGDWPRYLVDLMRFDELIAERNVTHGDYVVGGTPFTSGADYTGWLNFQLREEQFKAMAAALLERYERV